MNEREEARPEADHWHELAQQLGLEPDAKPAAKVEARSVAPAPSEPAARPPAVQRQPVWEESPPLDMVVSEEREDRTESAALESETEIADPPEEDAEAAKPAAGGRRRRRRGGTKRGPERAGEERPPREGGSAGDDDRERPRRRGRGRPRSAPVVAESEPIEPDETDELPDEPAPPRYADDDEPVETFSNWTVPSWNELIASLYRPER